MKNKTPFIGREKELNALEKRYNQPGFQMVVLYGRRRVGKTSLIQEFCKDKPHMLYVSIEQNDHDALASFSKAVLEVFPKASRYMQQFDNWENVFQYITEEAGDQRFIIAIDEYPYLAAGNPSISSILQKVIDLHYLNTNLYLILCGSSLSFMEHQVLGYQSPLYGRRTGQLKIEAFDYYESAMFFPEWKMEEKLMAYGVAGGIPQYLNRLALENNLWEGIKNNFLSTDGFLFEEPSNLLKQELREPAVYNSIIAAIAGGAGRLGEIAAKSGEEPKKCTKYINALMDLQIVKKESPVGENNQRKSRYVLTDQLFTFWYRFIPANITLIETDMGDALLEQNIKPLLPEYMGQIFEAICLQYLLRINRHQKLPFLATELGRWWGNNPQLKKEEEIDIVSFHGEKALFGECKWRNEKLNQSVLKDLVRKSQLFKQIKEPHYYLFSKSGVTPGVKKEAELMGNVYLITPADLLKTEL